MAVRRIGVLIVALALALVGCSDAKEKTGGAGSGGQAAGGDGLRATLQCDSQPTADEAVSYQVPKANKRYKITLMEVSLAGYYYQGIKYGAEQAAKEAGVDLTVQAAQGYASPDLQLKQVEDAIQRGADAIVLAPSDIKGSVPVVQRARADGKPVVNISTEVASPEVYMVMQDDYVLGRLAADRVAQVVGPDGGPGIVIAGPANATWSRKRTLGFTDQIKEKYPNLKVAAAPTQLVDPGQGLKSFEDAVQANPDVKWIFSVHYFILQPASLPSKYQGKVPYVSFGYEPDSIKGLQDGTLDSVFGIEPVAMGRVGVGTAVSLLNGASQPRVNCLPAPLFTKTEIGSRVANGELTAATG